jgi:ABC-2 type transport system ATP-binding protein
MTLTIHAQGLVKRFGKTVALNGLDLVAESGVILAVLGPNGAGKTTFIRSIATLIKPDAGTLRVFGRDVEREPHSVRRAIGLAGQFAAVEPAMTGRENLEMIAGLCGKNRAAQGPLLLDVRIGSGIQNRSFRQIAARLRGG